MPVLKTNILVILLTTALLGIGIYTYFLHHFGGLDIRAAITISLIYSLMLSAAVWAILLIINAYPTRVGIVTYALILGVFFGGAAYSGDILLQYLLGDRESDSLIIINKTGLVRLFITCLICCWVSTATALQKKNRELRTAIINQQDASSLLREAELYKLRQQLQPHFLYNSLNSISALTMIAPEKAQEMIGKLSDFLRTSVRREAQDLIPIQEELDYIEAYLAIESIRFGNRLKVNFEKEYTDDAFIPPFLLQPLLENAIKFGLYGTTGTVNITMHIVYEEPFLKITFTNPFDREGLVPKGTGFGLRGIERRLFLIYARTDLLETKKNENIFTTILKIPQAHV